MNQKNKAIIILLIWIVYGIFNWNVTIAACSNSDIAKIIGRTPRDYYSFALFVAILGPIGTIATPFATNLYEHSFTY